MPSGNLGTSAGEPGETGGAGDNTVAEVPKGDGPEEESGQRENPAAAPGLVLGQLPNLRNGNYA